MELEKLENNYELTFEVILEQFQTSMNALTFQDYHSSEKSLIIARNAYLSMDNENVPIEDLNFLGIFVKMIEVTTLTIKSVFLTFEERFDKAKSITEAALLISNESRKILEKLKKNQYDFGGFDDLFSFYFLYFKLVLSGSLLSLNAGICKKEGKFINEISLKADIVNIYRKINQFVIDVNSPMSQAILGMRGALNKIADTTELQIEKLKERNKTINFLPPIDNKVFLIHGHGISNVREFKELMTKHFEISPIILIDEPNKGKTIIEKIEDYGMNCAFAFAILTPDDWVDNDSKQYFQARPNVLFELGWFIGRYGRDKVRIIKKKGTELPSDLSGLITINFSENIAEVFLNIKQELEDFGLLK